MPVYEDKRRNGVNRMTDEADRGHPDDGRSERAKFMKGCVGLGLVLREQ